MRQGAIDIKNHRWYNDVDWNMVVNRKYSPPIKPVLKSVSDTSNFDDYSEEFNPDEAEREEFELFNDF